MAHREILRFHQDDDDHWVAELACGHPQHVRHKPPLEKRPQVTTAEGRAGLLGTRLDCPFCDMPALPPGAEEYRRTKTFESDPSQGVATIPAGLLADHTTKAGTWGRIVVERGKLLYALATGGPAGADAAPDAAGLRAAEVPSSAEPWRSWVLRPGIDGVIAPQVPHRVRPVDAEREPVAFHVRFLRVVATLLVLAALPACDGCQGASARGRSGGEPTTQKQTTRHERRADSAAPSASTSAVAPAGSPAASTSAAPSASAAPSGRAAIPRVETSSPARTLTWRFDDVPDPIGPMRVVVVVPARQVGDEKLPVLVALHGLGEALKGPARGARGWLDDYEMDVALKRLRAVSVDSSQHLKKADFHGFVTKDRLQRLNADLERTPYRGLVIACAYTPAVFKDARLWPSAEVYATFLKERLLPRLYAETPAVGTPLSTGIDGVSLGGRVAVASGLLIPRSFGAIAGLQAALDPRELDVVADKARQATDRQPGIRFRFLTSEYDFFKGVTADLSRKLWARGVKHTYRKVPGPHDYVFNQGPGVYEMLLFHDRALRGEPDP